MPMWPIWWDWELELSAHLFKRTADRDFNEIAIIATRYRRAPWEVIVEPDATGQLLVVVTAYPVEP